MNKALSLAVLAAGTFLMVMSLLVYNAAPSEASGLAPGAANAAPSLWVPFIGAVGFVGAAAGLLGLLRGFRGYMRAFSKTTNSMTE
jgi:hypothetical protein